MDTGGGGGKIDVVENVVDGHMMMMQKQRYGGLSSMVDFGRWKRGLVG